MEEQSLPTVCYVGTNQLHAQSAQAVLNTEAKAIENRHFPNGLNVQCGTLSDARGKQFQVTLSYPPAGDGLITHLKKLTAQFKPILCAVIGTSLGLASKMEPGDLVIPQRAFEIQERGFAGDDFAVNVQPVEANLPFLQWMEMEVVNQSWCSKTHKRRPETTHEYEMNFFLRAVFECSSESPNLSWLHKHSFHPVDDVTQNRDRIKSFDELMKICLEDGCVTVESGGKPRLAEKKTEEIKQQITAYGDKFPSLQSYSQDPRVHFGTVATTVGETWLSDPAGTAQRVLGQCRLQLGQPTTIAMDTGGEALLRYASQTRMVAFAVMGVCPDRNGQEYCAELAMAYALEVCRVYYKFDRSVAGPTMDGDVHKEPVSVDLSSLLPALASNLYGDDWRVTIRELLQNAHDALVRVRQSLDRSGGIEIIADTRKSQLEMRDNGIGMTLHEVRVHLATIGESSKRHSNFGGSSKGQPGYVNMQEEIGQFGIGFLASFIIATRVDVYTKSTVHTREPGIHAIFEGNQNWQWTYDETILTPGTRVVLTIKDDFIPSRASRTGKDPLPFGELVNVARRFGELLPFPIRVYRGREDKYPDTANICHAPWENDSAAHDELQHYVQERFDLPQGPIKCWPFRFTRDMHRVTASGLLFVPSDRGDVKFFDVTTAPVDVFVRRMFICDMRDSLLPRWGALFVGGVVECPDLVPTLNRNDVLRDTSEAFHDLKVALDNFLIDSLEQTAEKEGSVFNEIVSKHRHAMVPGLLGNFKDAKENEEHYFRRIVPFMPLLVVEQHRLGGYKCSIRKYLEQHGRRQEKDGVQRIFFTHARSDYLRTIVLQYGMAIVLPEKDEELQMLRAYGSAFPDVEVVEASTIIETFETIEDPKGKFECVRKALLNIPPSTAPRPDSVTFCRFDPEYIPMVIEKPQAQKEEDKADQLGRLLEKAGHILSTDVRRIIARDKEVARDGRVVVHLKVNVRNDLIRDLRDGLDQPVLKRQQLCMEILQDIYFSLMTHAVPESYQDKDFVHYSRNSLYDQALKDQMRVQELEEEGTQKTTRLTQYEQRIQKMEQELQALQAENDVYRNMGYAGPARRVPGPGTRPTPHDHPGFGQQRDNFGTGEPADPFHGSNFAERLQRPDGFQTGGG